MRRITAVAVVITALAVLGCEGLMGGAKSDAELVKDAESKLQDGDLPGALGEYEKLSKENPESIGVATGLAYLQLLQGQYSTADETLAKLDNEKLDPKARPELKMRRALIWLRTGVPEDLDKVKEFAEASGMPAGKLISAEIYLADADPDGAKPLLESVSGESGAVGETAKNYLDLLNASDPVRPQLAQATAIWALGSGSRPLAVETAEDLLKNLPPDAEGRDGLLLLWAGRAVSSGHADIAEGLLDEISVPPEGQAWRKSATEAIIHISKGENEEGIGIFTNLAQAGAPQDGLADAMATAAMLTQDKEVAKQLLAGVETNSAARGLLAAGAPVAAKEAAPPGSLKQFLENR